MDALEASTISDSWAHGLGKANVVNRARQNLKPSIAANCSVDISMWAFCPPVRWGEGRCDFHTVQGEAAVEVDHTKESSELASGSRIGVFRYIFDFGLEEPNN